MFCPHCGTACEESHRFCFRCGSVLPEILTESNDIPEEIPVPMPEPESLPEVPAEPEPLPEVPAEPEPLPEVPAEPEQELLTEPAPAPAEPKGRLWPPVLMLGIIACVGLLVYFMTTFQPAPAVQSDTPWFSVKNGVLEFHAEYYTGDAELIIPSVIDGQTVTAIGNHAFSGCDLISTVILPDTVIRIGDYAFSSCHKLRGIYIPESVDLIGVYTFADCSALEAIYIPGELELMGEGALDSCDKLKFILFNGTCAQWNELYEGRFVTEVELHATDGVFYAQP